LISRSGNLSNPTDAAARCVPFPAVALLSDPAMDVREYLEDLVRIAVGSARQAEDMLVHARKASSKASRGLALIASVGALGLLVGIAGFAASHSANVSLSQVRGEVSALRDMQQQAQDQLADIAARTPTHRDLAEDRSQPRIAPAVIVVPHPSAPIPVQPWPDSHPAQRVHWWH
jgi:hypothetical protein